jgi:hypothetical protein
MIERGGVRSSGPGANGGAKAAAAAGLLVGEGAVEQPIARSLLVKVGRLTYETFCINPGGFW